MGVHEGIEASTPSEWVARHLESLGFEVKRRPELCAHACHARQEDQDRQARCAHPGAGRAAWGLQGRAPLSDAQRAVRTHVQVRQSLVQMRTKLINQIGAELLRSGYRVGTGAAEHFERRLSQVELEPELASLLEPLVSMLQPLNERIEKLDKELCERAKKDEPAARLQQIPGVGPIISLMFVAVLDGAGRFEGAHQVMSYLGLVPREKSSGDKQLRGHITQAGHRGMRVLLVQAAMGVMRLKKPQTQRLHQWAEQIEQRRGNASPRWRWPGGWRA